MTRRRRRKKNNKSPKTNSPNEGKVVLEKPAVDIEDFYCFAPRVSFIYKWGGPHWGYQAVNLRIPGMEFWVPGKNEPVCAAEYIGRTRSVESITWAPGYPQIVQDRLASRDGGWIEKEGVRTFNEYRPPVIVKGGDADLAGPWKDHVKLLYPESYAHIIDWLAYRVQHPEIKINHALVLGGEQGVGKDTLLVPVREAVGTWNFQEVSPTQMQGRFNGYLKSVILRVSESTTTRIAGGLMKAPRRGLHRSEGG